MQSKDTNKVIFIRLLLPILGLIFMIACADDSEKETDNKKPTPAPTTPAPKPEAKKHSNRGTDEYTEEKVDLGLSTQDKKFLSLIDSFSMGTPYKIIQDQMKVKGVAEDASKGMTKAKAKVTFLGRPAELEFNFKNDSLYSFFYTIVESDFNKSEKLYKGIKQYYNKKYYLCEEPVAEEETKYLKSCYWKEKSPYGVMSYDINTGTINWGFQNSKP